VRTLAAATLAAAALAGCGSGDGAHRPAVFQVAVGSGLRPDEVATAFALGPGRLVTVAHVLGRRAPGATVRLQGARRATILAIDERDDLALLAVPGLRAARARLGTARGDVLVLVVRNGSVRALPAEVRRAIIARIRTPDGRRVVRRHALELRADVQPGDSGAPVVGRDGRVAGVVFAQSHVRPHTAYAVAVSALGSPRLRPAGRS
jgi:S1-C subfamily serine protease